MTVAYVVFSHQHPEQVRRLLRTLRAGSPEAVLISHHHPEPLAAPGVSNVLPPTRVTWGGASQLLMVLRSLRHALTLEWDWVVLLSGQDYPLRPLADIERDLASRGVAGYVETVPVEPGDEFHERYFNRWRRVRPWVARVPSLKTRALPGGVLVGRPATPPLPVRRGSDWLSLSRAAAEVVAGAPPAVVEHFRRTILPTEALPHSLLHASGLPLSGDTRRFTRWDPGASHPHLLGLADLDAMLASGLDFARKFPPGDPVLDELDRRL